MRNFEDSSSSQGNSRALRRKGVGGGRANSNLPLRRPSRQTLQDRIYESLREAISAGKFVPGQKLSNRGLAEVMGTSPIPVREALRRLVSERGLVVLRNGSVAVPQFTAAQFRDLRWVRCSVEKEAATRGAEYLHGTSKIARLQKYYTEMCEAYEKGNRERYLLANKKFHFGFYGECRSPILLSIIDSLWLQFGPFVNFVYTREAFEFGMEHHRDALTALSRGDFPAVGQALADDVFESGDYILSSDYFKEQSEGGLP